MSSSKYNGKKSSFASDVLGSEKSSSSSRKSKHKEPNNYDDNPDDDSKSRHKASSKSSKKSDNDTILDDRSSSRHHKSSRSSKGDESSSKSSSHKKTSSTTKDYGSEDNNRHSSRRSKKYDDEEESGGGRPTSSYDATMPSDEPSSNGGYYEKRQPRGGSTSRRRETPPPSPIKEEREDEEEQGGGGDDYDEDFENDFEEDEEEYVATKPSKAHIKSPPSSSTSNYKNDNDDDEDYRRRRRKDYDEDDEDEEYRRRSSKKDRHHRKNKYDDDDYDDSRRGGSGRVVKAMAHVHVPTEHVQVFSSKIYYNHDSVDRQRRRARDLVTTIEQFDKKSFNLIDINPSEMRTVYSSHLKHAKLQTNDDLLDIELQTDDIDYSTKWTQHPADDLKGCGSADGRNEDAAASNAAILEKFRADINFLRLQQFLNKSARVVEAILGEREASGARMLASSNKTDLQFSQGYTTFALPRFVAKLLGKETYCVVSQCAFNKDDSNFFVCAYKVGSGSSWEQYTTLLTVWNVNQLEMPYRTLICESQSTSLCYTSFMVFSGNIDGSVVVWDLRESYSLHLLTYKAKVVNEFTVLRSPTYTTAGVLMYENHSSEVKSILPVHSSSTKANDKGVFMQLCTLEVDCKLIIWTVVELTHVDLAGFETDLGLLPGGRIKLVKSSQIQLNNLIKSSIGRIQYQTHNMTFPSNQSNHLYICTNAGRIIHITRESGSSSYSFMRSDLTDSMLDVTCATFHHDVPEILLAGYGNGELRMYHTSYVTPIKSWILACVGNRIKDIQWIQTRKSAFIVVDVTDTIYIWDLLEDDTGPIFSKQFIELGSINLSYAPKRKHSSEQESSSGESPFCIYTLNSKEVEVHLFSREWTKTSDKEAKKFQKLIKLYIANF